MPTQTIQTLTQMKTAGAFKTFINHIRFPHYKHLRPNTRITFDFPVTVLIGQNGTGKSSTLQALYGAPRDKSVGNFWFSTEVDPILETKNGLRHCFIYGYSDPETGKESEVLKIRIKRKGNPNYWEPSRPYKIYGMRQMGGKRNPAIQMEVVYLDFRGILSAFDKCFYFGSLKHRSSKTKQEYILYQSKQLKKVVDGEIIISIKGHPQNQKPLVLSDKELAAVSDILGRKYIKATIIKHSFYDDEGLSVVFETSAYTYSEAFAGSGETKVVMLVHSIHKAAKGALVLLDEPEVSLHPGAQKRLQHYLLQQAKEKLLQVIVSTHSPHLAAGLPSSGIKVFIQEKSGQVEIREGYTVPQAFLAVGQLPATARILVEDILAKKIILTILNGLGNGAENLFEVEFYPGGESAIKRSIVHYSRDRFSKTFVILDGDQNVKSHFDAATITIADTTVEHLAVKIKEQTGCDIRFDVDGQNDSGRNDQRIKQQLMYLDFYLSNVKYFPSATPEELIWNSQFALDLLISTHGEKARSPEFSFDSHTSAKAKLKRLAEWIANDNLESIYEFFVGHAKVRQDEQWRTLTQTVQDIILKAAD